MGLTTEEFVAAFHSLDGATIAERKKDLYRLLNANTNCKIDLHQIRPSSDLDEGFKADVVIFFKDYGHMLKLLKNEHLGVIGRLLKQDWFIQRLSENLSGEDLVSDIFPNISYNAKLKILSRLAMVVEDRSKGDEFFKSVLDSYGLYMASKLLPSCNEGLILKTLDGNIVELTPRQLLLIIQRNPTLTLTVIEKVMVSKPNIDFGAKYHYVFSHLMKTDPSILIQLDDRCNHRFKLGKRATRRFLAFKSDLFLQHTTKFHNLLQENEIGRILPEELTTIFSNVLPKSFNDFITNSHSYLSMLDVLPSNRTKLEILLAVFADRYGGQLTDLLVPKVFEWMSPDFKRNWMSTHTKPTEIPEIDWISYMCSDQSIALLTKMLSSTSNMKERVKLVTALVRSCKINNDLVALGDLCEYFVSKHRNDHIKVKVAFLGTLHECFKLRVLGEEHWKHLKQLVSLCIGMDYTAGLIAEKFVVGLLYFSLKNGRPIREHLEVYAKLSRSYNVLEFQPEYEKKCLQEFYEVLPLCFQNEELEYQRIQFLQSICNWNKRHRNDMISVMDYKEAMDTVMADLSKNDYYCTAHDIAIECVIYEYERAHELILPQILLSKTHVCPYITKVIRRYPLYFREHSELLVDKFCNSYTSLFSLRRLFRNFVDPNTRERVARICETIIDDTNESGERKRFATYILSFVTTPTDFLQFVRRFYPNESVAKLDDPNYNLQQAIPSCLRYFDRPFIAFEPILQFCQGDYMQFAQKSLYHIAHNTAERRLPDFLNELARRAVSVRKHAIFLSFKLLSKAATLSHLTRGEKNASIRKSLLQSILNNFLRDPTASTWDLVQQTVGTIDSDDVDAFKIFTTRLARVPKQFYSSYIVFTWKYLEELPLSPEIVSEHKGKILEAIGKETIAMLPEDFCTDLIRSNLRHENISGFVANYILFSHRSDLSEVFGIIRNNLRQQAKVTNAIIRKLCDRTKANQIAGFITLWDKTVKPYEALPEHVNLHLTQLTYLQSAVMIGRKLSEFHLALCQENCGDLHQIRESFRDGFRERLLANLDGSDEVNHMIIIESIVKYDEGYECLALGLALLPDLVYPLPKVQKIYDAIIESATKCSHPSVQIMLRKHLINKE